MVRASPEKVGRRPILVAAMRVSLGKDCPGRVDAIGRDDLLRPDVYVCGWDPDSAAALVARYDFAGERVGAPELGGGLRHISAAYEFAKVGAADERVISLREEIRSTATTSKPC